MDNKIHVSYFVHYVYSVSEYSVSLGKPITSGSGSSCSHLSEVRKILVMLWHVYLLLGDDRETSYYTACVAKLHLRKRQ